MDEDGQTAGAGAPDRGETLTLPDDGVQPAPSRELAAGTQVDRYVVVRRLGEGGMGTVWLAEDPELDRPVALKFLRGDGETMSARRRERLKREGRAMAKLAHPNVAVVYDVGTYFGQLFIAMQYVEGGTLRDWMEEGAHSWREVWRMLRPAGEALAAAHESGIVHRDFKPENVLVGDGDRLVVSDFGLAKAEGERDQAAEDGNDDDSAAMPAATLTGTGALVGTPRYMAPEQHAGQPATAESDQFAFAMVLWEALAGVHPFEGEQSVDVAASIIAGRRRAWPDDSAAPRWVRQRLERALDPDPAKRFSGMQELLAVLDRDPATRRRRWLVAGAIGVVVAGALTYGLTRRAAATPACTDGAETWAGIWDDGVSQEVRNATAATKLPYADDAWKLISRTMDAYVAKWRALHVSICKATYHEHQQSPAMLDREMACLDRRRRQANALLDLYRGKVPVRNLERVSHFATGLGDLDACSSAASQAGRSVPPSNQADRAEIEAIEDLISKARALRVTGDFQEARKVSDEAVSRADVIAYAPVLSEALTGLGSSMVKQGKLKEAEEVLERAANVAASAGDSQAELIAWIGMMGRYNESVTDPSRADVLLTAAQSAFQRANPGKELTGNYYSARGGMLLLMSRHREAKDCLARAVENYAVDPGKDSSYYTVALSNEGHALVALGKTDAGIELERQALEETKRFLGPNHPEVAEQLASLAEALSFQGNYQEAEKLLRHAIDVLQRSYGPDSVHLVRLLRNLAWAAAQLGRFDESEKIYLRTIDIQKNAGTPTAGLVETYGELASTYGLAGDMEKSREMFLQSLHLAESQPHPDDVDIALQRINLAGLLNMMHRYAEAEPQARQAIEVFSKSPDRQRYLAQALPFLGSALLGQDKAKEAIEPLQRAVSLLESISADPADIGSTRFILAQAVFYAGDHERARKLANQTLSDLSGAQSVGRTKPETVRNWLAKKHLDR